LLHAATFTVPNAVPCAAVPGGWTDVVPYFAFACVPCAYFAGDRRLWAGRTGDIISPLKPRCGPSGGFCWFLMPLLRFPAAPLSRFDIPWPRWRWHALWFVGLAYHAPLERRRCVFAGVTHLSLSVPSFTVFCMPSFLQPGGPDNAFASFSCPAQRTVLHHRPPLASSRVTTV